MIEPLTYCRLAVAQQLQPVALEDGVVLALFVEGELVLEARAATSAHADPQARDGRVGLLFL
jgi:hypothetical protein